MALTLIMFAKKSDSRGNMNHIYWIAAMITLKVIDCIVKSFLANYLYEYSGLLGQYIPVKI